MTRDIWEKMKRMQRSMDEAFEDFFGNEPFSPTYKLLATPRSGKDIAVRENFALPQSDFWETEKDIKAEIDLPGIEKKDIKLNIVKGRVEVKAEKKSEQKEDRKGRYRLERSYHGFYRSFSLPENADTENAEAKYENGVLKLKIPKKGLPEPKAKIIEVK